MVFTVPSETGPANENVWTPDTEGATASSGKIIQSPILTRQKALQD